MANKTNKALVLGTFDGVHCAHTKLISQTRAASEGAKVVAVTFDRIPGSVLGADAKSKQIISCEDKCMLLMRSGADEVKVLRFDSELSIMDPAAFFEKIILGEFEASHLAVGHDFRFGYKGAGDTELLGRLCPAAGIKLLVLGELKQKGVRVSSSEIRRRISAGDPKGAAEMLGRVHAFNARTRDGRMEADGSFVLPPVGFRFASTVTETLPLEANNEGCIMEAVLEDDGDRLVFSGIAPLNEGSLVYVHYATPI